MTERNRIAPQYQGMSFGREKSAATGARSETEAQIDEMREGENWSLEATERAYTAGGNENGPVQENGAESPL